MINQYNVSIASSALEDKGRPKITPGQAVKKYMLINEVTKTMILDRIE